MKKMYKDREEIKEARMVAPVQEFKDGNEKRREKRAKRRARR